MKFTEKAVHFSTPAGKIRLLAHLPHMIKLYWRLLLDRRVSWLPKIILVGGILYCITPLDIIPDFPLVGFGQMDDLAVLLVTARMFIAMAPRRVVEEHVELIDQGV